MAIQVNGMFSLPRAINFESVLTEGDEYFVRHENGQWRVYRYENSKWTLLGLVVTRQEQLVLEFRASEFE